MNDLRQPVAPSDRMATVSVWLVWAVMTGVLVTLFAADRSSVPLAEDWYMVPAYTGHEPDFFSWLLSQNNEHRVPVPRLVYLAILFLTGGKFAAVGWFNLALQSATAAGLIIALRRLRGHTDVADAFFPLLLLHWGHSAQFLFPFLVSLLIPVSATLLLGCVLARPQSLARGWVAALASFALLVLPGCGFVGLLHVPVFATVLGAAAWTHRRQAPAAALLIAVAIALTMLGSALYFVDYYTPWWNPPNPGWLPSLRTALRVLSLGFGLAPLEAGKAFVALTVVLMLATAWCLVRAARYCAAGERLRTWATLLFAVDTVGFALAVGWSRSGWVPQFGIPSRYAVFAIPAFASCYLAWALLGPGRWRCWVPRALAVVLLMLVPWNTRAGNTYFADWYRQGMRAVHADLRAGIPLDELARRHQPFLFHALKPETIAEHMQWLREAGVPAFDRASDQAP